MKLLLINIVPILLVLLAGYMVYVNKPYYGWVIFAAVVTVVYPTKMKA
jgi:hypothetical protein